ncbi:hypothetical protein M513_12933 [Trichuris suis]|uniref:Uncharacterized protein n=1 Tax=Trichuris suis TaxID=68888 RepID=A0A085LMI9_9BILA|nr:hypothetical protein M513_12933 [Trichuris suis]
MVLYWFHLRRMRPKRLDERKQSEVACTCLHEVIFRRHTVCSKSGGRVSLLLRIFGISSQILHSAKYFFQKKPNMQICINIPPLMTFTLPMLAQHVAIFKHTTARCIRHSKRTFPFSLTRIPRTDIVLGRVDPRQSYLF